MKLFTMRVKKTIALLLLVSIVFCFLSPYSAIYAELNVTEIDENSCLYKSEKCCIEFKVSSYWDGGYCAECSITNTSNSILEDWAIELSFINNKIENIWNASINSNNGYNYIIGNAEWNQDIRIGDSVSFGMVLSGDFSEFPSFNLLGETMVVSSTPLECKYMVTDDWREGFNGDICVRNPFVESIKEWKISFELDNEITNIWNAEIIEHYGTHYMIKGLDYNQNISGLSEIHVGFTVQKGSADKGAYNIVVYEDIPFYDSSNLVLEESEYCLDFDKDGVVNYLESFFDLDIYKSDSDDDGISDYEDILLFMEEYLSHDTDGDGISDASELRNGLNPLLVNSYNDGLYDGERIVRATIKGCESDYNGITPSVSLNILGNQIDSLKLEKINDYHLFLNSSIPGYLSNGYDISVSGDFSGAELVFNLPDGLVDSDEVYPAVYYWNTESQKLEKVSNQRIIDNKVVAELDHFSQYILLDDNLYSVYSSSVTISNPANVEMVKNQNKVVLLLDESNSIYNADFTKIKNACISLTDNMSKSDLIEIYTFDDTVRKISSFIDKDNAKNIIQSINQHKGNTAIRDALVRGIDDLKGFSSEDVSKKIVILTDGYSNSDITDYSYGEIAQIAKYNNIVIFTIGIGSEYDTSNMKLLADLTGGHYYSIENYNNLVNVFNEFISDKDLYMDSDSDGISDYHEKQIANGSLRLGSGAKLTGQYLMDPFNPDSDGDGLWDGEEISIVTGDRSASIIMTSSPLYIDTDFDGLNDYAEDVIGLSPLIYDLVNDNEGVPVLASSTIGDSEMPGIWIGTWRKMASLFSWHYIHDLVVSHICTLNPSLKKEKILSGAGRADIIDILKHEVWEVKPISYYTVEGKLDNAISQLDRYVSAASTIDGIVYHRGTILEPIESDSFISPDGQFFIQYSNAGNGIIIYSYSIINRGENESETDPVFLPIVEPTVDKDDSDVVYTPIPNPDWIPAPVPTPTPEVKSSESINKSSGAIKMSENRNEVLENGMKVVAILAILGTIVEDVITGGVGIADDVASIQAALALWLGS